MSIQLPPSTVEQAIENAALGPASVTVGNQTVTSKDIGQLIEADQYLRAKQAADTPNFGMRFRRFQFPGAW